MLFLTLCDGLEPMTIIVSKGYSTKILRIVFVPVLIMKSIDGVSSKTITVVLEAQSMRASFERLDHRLSYSKIPKSI